MSKEINWAGRTLIVDNIKVIGQSKQTSNSGNVINSTREVLNHRKAGNAQTSANNAQQTANTAQQTANGAQATANSAIALATLSEYKIECSPITITRNDRLANSQLIDISTVITGYTSPNPRIRVSGQSIICAYKSYYQTQESGYDIDSLEDLYVPNYQFNNVFTGDNAWYRYDAVFDSETTAIVNFKAQGGEDLSILCDVISRSTSSNYLTLKVNSTVRKLRGYDNRDNTDVTLYVPYINAGALEVYLYDGTTLKDKYTLAVIDETSDPVFLGLKTSLPEKTNDGNILINGDSFVVDVTGISGYVAGSVYSYSNGSWVLSNSSSMLFDGLDALLVNERDLNTINDANTVSYFNRIVSNELFVKTMFANRITMTSQSIIESDSWKNEPAVLPSIPDTAGYRLNGSTGIISANRMEAKDFHAYGDSVIDGNLNNPRLKTFAGGDNQISISNLSPIAHYNIQYLFNYLGANNISNVSGSLPNIGSFTSIRFTGIWTGIKSIGVYFARSITISNNVLQLYGEFASSYPSGVTVYVGSPVTFTNNTTGVTYSAEVSYEYSLATLYSEIGSQRVMFTGTINGTTVTDKNAGYFLYMSSAQDLTATFPDNSRISVNSSSYSYGYISFSNAVVYTSEDLIKASTIIPIGSNKQIGDGTNNFKVYGAVFN